MLNLWKELERGIVALNTHEEFVWYSRVAHGNVFEYSDGKDLFVIQYTEGKDEDSLLVTRLIKGEPIEFLFDGFTGKFDLLTDIEEVINDSLKDRYEETDRDKVMLLKPE